MYNRKAFKQEAKVLMRESKPHFKLVSLVYFLLTTGLSLVVSNMSAITGIGAGLMSTFLSIMVTLFGWVMIVGYANYALTLSRKGETGMNSLFESFSFAGRSIGVVFLQMLYIFAWTLLLMFGMAILMVVVFFAAGDSTVAAVIGVSVMYIVLFAFVIFITLRYAMCEFALVDNPDAGCGEAIRRSVRIMRGNKGKLFVLNLSFIGWDILVGLIHLAVLCIGFFACGATWVFDAISGAANDPLQMGEIMSALNVQMSLWTVLAEVVSIPLTIWLLAYKQATMARFFNYAGGYDKYVENYGQAPVREEAAAIPVAREGAADPAVVSEAPGEEKKEPVKPEKYYTPAPDLDKPEQEAKDPEEDQEI